MLGCCPSNPSSHHFSSLFKASCKCSCNKKPGKNLVVCIDGTSNTRDDTSHVFELYDNIVKDDQQQIGYYASGVGTDVRPEGFVLVERILKKLDLAIAHIGENILTAYEWLSDRYHDGDKIFLFGFSRGAYQVRALAGMIHEVGLIRPGNGSQISSAFQYYCSINSGKSKDINGAKEFKMRLSRSVAIHFIGVWDTVSSVGVRKTKNFPSTDTCDHVCYFRQALALDERRVRFLPEYVYGGMRSDWHKYQVSAPSPTDEGRIKEVWFAGSHSDVGGARWKKKSYPNDFRNIPLLWMLEEAREAGLLLNPREVAFKHENESFLKPEVTDPSNLAWWLLEILPIGHLCFNSNTLKALPHLGRGRIIMPGQKIHESVLFRPNYRPKAHFWMNVQQWPEAVQWYIASAEERLSQLDFALELLSFKGSTAEALVCCIFDKQMLDNMYSFELAVKLGKANTHETLEAILSIDGKLIAGTKRSKDSGEEWSLADSEKNGDADEAKEERNIRLVRLDAFITYCERVKSKDIIIKCILDDLFQFCFFWISTCVLWRVLLYAGLNTI